VPFLKSPPYAEYCFGTIINAVAPYSLRYTARYTRVLMHSPNGKNSLSFQVFSSYVWNYRAFSLWVRTAKALPLSLSLSWTGNMCDLISLPSLPCMPLCFNARLLSRLQESPCSHGRNGLSCCRYAGQSPRKWLLPVLLCKSYWIAEVGLGKPWCG